MDTGAGCKPIGFEVSQAGAAVKGEFRRFDSEIGVRPQRPVLVEGAG